MGAIHTVRTAVSPCESPSGDDRRKTKNASSCTLPDAHKVLWVQQLQLLQRTTHLPNRQTQPPGRSTAPHRHTAKRARRPSPACGETRTAPCTGTRRDRSAAERRPISYAKARTGRRPSDGPPPPQGEDEAAGRATTRLLREGEGGARRAHTPEEGTTHGQKIRIYASRAAGAPASPQVTALIGDHVKNHGPKRDWITSQVGIPSRYQALDTVGDRPPTQGGPVGGI
jgi:hypothetical protein